MGDHFLTRKIGGHKIEAKTYTGPGSYNGLVCAKCEKAITSKPGSMGYRHNDYTPPR